MIGIIILSGGQGRRMGGQDKGWCCYRETTYIEAVLNQLQSQIACEPALAFKLFISANRNITDYKELGYEVICDERADFCGPLSGIESVIRFHQETDSNQEINRWLTYPVDSPEVPDRYIALMLNLEPSQIGYLEQDGRKHFAHLSIPSSQQSLISEQLDCGQRAIKGWLAKSGLSCSVMLNPQSHAVLNLNEETAVSA